MASTSRSCTPHGVTKDVYCLLSGAKCIWWSKCIFSLREDHILYDREMKKFVADLRVWLAVINYKPLFPPGLGATKVRAPHTESDCCKKPLAINLLTNSRKAASRMLHARYGTHFCGCGAVALEGMTCSLFGLRS